MAMSDEEYASVMAPFIGEKYGIPDISSEDAYRIAFAEARGIRAQVQLAKLDRKPVADSDGARIAAIVAIMATFAVLLLALIASR